MHTPIYLDYNSTTPLDSRVLTEMLPVLSKHYGNPSSNHCYGWYARELVEIARERIAKAIGAQAQDIIFTSCATESNNLAVLGFLASCQERGVSTVYISSRSEHQSILEPLKIAAQRGAVIHFASSDRVGQIAPEDVAKMTRFHRANFISLMLANNETGVITDIGGITKRLNRSHNMPLFHSDASQCLGRMAIDVEALGVDLLTLSAHKCYGPKGVGALYIRAGKRKEIQKICVGGGQESGIRSGTENVANIVGFGKAAEIATQELEERIQKLATLEASFFEALALRGVKYNITCGHEPRLPGVASVVLCGATASSLIGQLSGKLAISSGSACSDMSERPSEVLTNIGLTKDEIQSSLRISFGVPTTNEECEEAAEIIANAYFIVSKHRSITSVL